MLPMSEKYTKLEEFINDIMVDTSINNKESGEDTSKKIVISTIHRAKGLEWDHVFICNMEPMYKAAPREDEGDDFCVSEDARLLYVAITRAKTCICFAIRYKRKSASYVGGLEIKKSRRIV